MEPPEHGKRRKVFDATDRRKRVYDLQSSGTEAQITRGGEGNRGRTALRTAGRTNRAWRFVRVHIKPSDAVPSVPLGNEFLTETLTELR